MNSRPNTRAQTVRRISRTSKQTVRPRPQRQIIGHRTSKNVSQLYNATITNDTYSISNNIGIGILSYNRLSSIKRLINSIRTYTDLTQTTVFVSDESSLDEVKNWLRQQSDIVLIDNKHRLGIAGNTNRLLNCLSRFRYKLLLNDDVEILHRGWDTFYFDTMAKTKFHHFCFRQPGVYGARTTDGVVNIHKDVNITTISDKPQGSVMAFDQKAFEIVGYFDEKFGYYGMEHVDWSHRIQLAGIQPPGYHDVENSSRYFKIWDDKSAVDNRITHLTKARELYNVLSTNEDRIYINQSADSNVPSISYIIPYRNADKRNNSINTVLNNIRAQRFPNIEMIVAEQDFATKCDINTMYPIQYLLSKSMNPAQQFCKGAAFNLGASNAHFNLILHDADIIVPRNYTALLYDILLNDESCHLGKQVLYLTEESTNNVNNINKVTITEQCDHAVDYFEGGSLAIRKSTYIDVGGFDENFKAYGCEDCDFYERIKNNSKFREERTIKMIHLWHDRTPGWEAYHKKNKEYLSSVKLKYNISQRCKMLKTTLINKYRF